MQSLSGSCLLHTVFLLVHLVTRERVHASHSTIELNNNEYTGIVVGFSPDIPDDSRQRESLVQEVQSLLESASDLLYQATEERSFFKEVTFLIPKNWDLGQWSLVNGGNVKRHRTLKLSDADFVVKSQGEAFTDNPFTIQYGGCGVPGLQMQLSQRFLTDSTGPSGQERAKAIVRQWTHYRYGTFSENGYPGDQLYPMYTSPPGATQSGHERITSCAASHNGPQTLRTVNTTRDGAICNLETDPSTGLPRPTSPDKACIPRADYNGNDGIVSSLMSHNLPSVKFFCDSKWHDPDAPNKQNALCSEASVWEVIFSHSDFAHGRNKAHRRSEPIKTQFKFVREADTRLGIIVDAGQRTELGDIVGQFTAKLEDDSQILVIDVGERNQASAGYKWLTKSLMRPQVIWGRPTDGPIELKAMVNLFLSELDKLPSSDETVSSELIIITAGNIEDSEADVNKMAAMLLEKHVSLQVVILPYTREHDVEPIRKLVALAGGTIQLVALEGPSEWRTAAQHGLFLDAMMVHDDHAYRHVLIKKKAFSGQRSVDFSFEVDHTLLKDGVTLVAGYVSQGLEKTSRHYNLKSPGMAFTTKSRDQYNKDQGRFEVPLGDPSFVRMTGNWTLHYQSDKDETLIGLAYAIVPRKAKPISGQCWLHRASSGQAGGKDGSPVTNHRLGSSVTGGSGQDEGPLSLYVSLTQDYNKLVQLAVVELTLTDDYGQPLNSTPPVIMSDNGLHADITAGDGIYSAYLLNLPNTGFYGARVMISGIDGQTRLHHGLRRTDSSAKGGLDSLECCGSAMPDSPEPPTYLYNLQRTLDCGFFHHVSRRNFDATGFTDRVTDLRVRHVDTGDRTVTLSWSRLAALPTGQLDSDEFRIFRQADRASLRADFDRGYPLEPIGSTRVDNELQVTLNVTLPEEAIYYLAMRSSGQVSNVVKLFMTADPNAITTTTSRTGLVAGIQTWLLIAIVTICLIMLVLCTACIMCLCGSGQRKKDTKDNEANFGSKSKVALDNGMSSLTIQTTMNASSNNLVPDKSITLTGISNEGSMVHDNRLNGSNVNQMSKMNSTISPVQSWPADFLVEQYEVRRQARERNEQLPVMRVEDLPVSTGSRSCSTSSNPSQETGSYEENVYNQRDWRYQNIGPTSGPVTHTAVPYHSQLGGLMYSDQYGGYDQGHMMANGLVNTAMSPDQADWRNSYAPQIETPPSSQMEYNVHYNAVPRRTNAVSQV
ncbi:Calcium-activated chloride channel regulator 1 [Halotydeus destructor]|nr:Calcium-activated chloride channel regulator 1 [Halotydeus destructor]